MKSKKRNPQTVKALILTGILLGFFIVSCANHPSKTVEAPGFTPTVSSVPEATLTPDNLSIQGTKTAIAAEKALLQETPTSTTTPLLATPTSTVTSMPTEAMACQWPPKRVLIISVDALRPDAVWNTPAAPYLLDLALKGSYTWNAQTTMPSITMTGHLSMLSGYDAPTHGIINNGIWQTPEAVVQIPTIFQRAKEANLTTVLIAGKGQFYYIQRGGFLDYYYITKGKKTPDSEFAARAVEYIKNNDFGLMFVHFPNVDEAGHAYEWMSPQYLVAVGLADAAIKTVIDALAEKGILDSTLVIVNADHGGTGISHGNADIPTNRTIPWMISGPCVKHGYQIQQKVNVFDTAVMALYGLNIQIPSGLDGKLICEVFKSPLSEQCLTAQPKK